MAQGFTINQLEVGQDARIVGYTLEEVPIKLYEMGLLPGTRVKVKQQLPMHGPIRLQLENNPNCIALRVAEAEMIFVQPDTL